MRTGRNRPGSAPEWLAFVHAVVTAGLMQHAPNSVLAGYLRETGNLLRAAETDAPAESNNAATAGTLAQADFVDGPFAAYMALLGHGEQAGCPELFCRRLAEGARPALRPNRRGCPRPGPSGRCHGSGDQRRVG